MRRPLVAGNWKMNGSLSTLTGLLGGVRQGAAEADGVDVAVFPPYVYLPRVQQELTGSRVGWGAQNLSDKESGAFTGEVAASMLLDFGCQYVLAGHSERRTLFGESDDAVAAKVSAARRAGLRPVLCIGETLEERENNTTEAVVARQLQAVIDFEGIQAFGDIVVAYEPVWAIGTGRTASPQQAQDVHAFIRGKLIEKDATIAASTRILYGGSVKGSNAAELFAMPDIDGGLVGGASLKAEDFVAIIKAAS